MPLFAWSPCWALGKLLSISSSRWGRGVNKWLLNVPLTRTASLVGTKVWADVGAACVIPESWLKSPLSPPRLNPAPRWGGHSLALHLVLSLAPCSCCAASPAELGSAEPFLAGKRWVASATSWSLGVHVLSYFQVTLSPKSDFIVLALRMVALVVKMLT